MAETSRSKIKQEQDAMKQFELSEGKYYVDTIVQAVEQMVRGIPPEWHQQSLEYLDAMSRTNCSYVAFWLKDALQKLIRDRMLG